MKLFVKYSRDPYAVISSRSIKIKKGNLTHSTGSFLASAPVELTTVKGYEDFISKQQKLKADVSTILNEDKSCGYVLKGGEAIATISGDAKDHLLALMGGKL